MPTDSGDLLLLQYSGEDQQGPAPSTVCWSSVCLGSYPHLLRLSMYWGIPKRYSGALLESMCPLKCLPAQV